MPPRAPPKSSPLARLLDPRLGMSAVRVVGEAIVTYAHAVVFSPAATPGFHLSALILIATSWLFATPTYNIREMLDL
jgi:hypothetical protein